MPSIQLTNLFSEFSQKVLQKTYVKEGVEYPRLWSQVFNDANKYADKNRSFFQAASVIPLGLMENMGEAQRPPLDSAAPGLTSTFLWTNYGLAYQISDDAQLEDPMGIVRMLPKMLSRSVNESLEYIFWNVLNMSFLNTAQGGYSLADGQALISAAHPLTGNPGITQSNYAGNVAFTVESLQAALTAFKLLKNDKGMLMKLQPKDVIYPPGYHQQVTEVLQSNLYPSTDQNRINVVANKLTPIEVPYLNPAQGPGPFPWWVSAGKGELGQSGHSMFAGMKYEKNWATVDPMSRTLIHAAKTRVSQGAFDWRGIYGSSGA